MNHNDKSFIIDFDEQCAAQIFSIYKTSLILQNKWSYNIGMSFEQWLKIKDDDSKASRVVLTEGKDKGNMKPHTTNKTPIKPPKGQNNTTKHFEW